jgi:sulfate transport system permease protein
MKTTTPTNKWSRRFGALPGFGLSLGVTLSFVSLLVLIPLGGMLVRAAGMSPAEFIQSALSPRAIAAYRLTFGVALLAAAANAVAGTLLAWVLVRYHFPGRRLVDALIDLPFALPTAVAGIALTALYAPNGWLGKPLGELGVEVAFTRLGIGVAMMFIGLPFVVRAVQPVLAEVSRDIEEAAASLGATRFQTVTRVILPLVYPSMVTGFALAFARAVGEYGSIVFIAGNMPMRTEIASLLIITRLEQYDYAGATAIATVMLAFSFAMLLALNWLQAIGARRRQEA